MSGNINMADATVKFAVAVTVEKCLHGLEQKQIASFPSQFTLKDIFENLHRTKNEETLISVKGTNSISAAAAAYELDLSLSVQNIHKLGVIKQWLLLIISDSSWLCIV